jgi:hypothetical protein
MFNMVKIIKNIKYMKILMKNSLMSPEVKQSLDHAEKNFINLDGSQDSSSDSTSRESFNIEGLDGTSPFDSTPGPSLKRYSTSKTTILKNLT